MPMNGGWRYAYPPYGLPVRVKRAGKDAGATQAAAWQIACLETPCNGFASINYFDTIGNMKTTQAVSALSALAQNSRLAIFRLLVQAGPEGLVAGQIGERLELPPATLSFHLKTLAQSGLVQGRQEGRFVRYLADFEAMHGLIDYLSENCCGSDRSVCAPSICKPCEEKTP